MEEAFCNICEVLDLFGTFLFRDLSVNGSNFKECHCNFIKKNLVTKQLNFACFILKQSS